MHLEEDLYQQFRTWYDQYFNFIYFFLIGYFKKRQIYVRESEIEDLVQNTFLSILERKSGAPIEYPMAYLKQTAISHARVFLDKKIRAGYHLPPEQALSSTPAPSKISAMEQQEEEQKVWQLMGSILNPLESEIMYKRVVKEYSYKEIAEEEGMPAASYLHTLFHRAKIKLSTHLKKNGK